MGFYYLKILLLLIYLTEEEFNKLKERDNKIFNKLYNRSKYYLYNYILTKMGDNDDIEDIVNDTMYVAWKRIAKLNNIDKYKSWITGIAKNLIYQNIKNKKNLRQNEKIIIENEISDLKDIQNSIYKVKEKANRVAIVKKIIDGLKPEYREIIMLRVLNGMEPDDISKKLKLKKKKVYNCISRALTKIRNELKMEKI